MHAGDVPRRHLMARSLWRRYGDKEAVSAERAFAFMRSAGALRRFTILCLLRRASLPPRSPPAFDGNMRILTFYV